MSDYLVRYLSNRIVTATQKIADITATLDSGDIDNDMRSQLQIELVEAQAFLRDLIRDLGYYRRS